MAGAISDMQAAGWAMKVSLAVAKKQMEVVEYQGRVAVELLEAAAEVSGEFIDASGRLIASTIGTQIDVRG